MLVLSRTEGESIQIGPDITVTILKSGTKIKIGIEAPRSINVARRELCDGSDLNPPTGRHVDRTEAADLHRSCGVHC